jgi:hypothetical protein
MKMHHHKSRASFSRGPVLATLLCSVVLAFAAPLPAQSQKTSDVIHIGQSVHVSADLPNEPHYEMVIAANPEDRNQLIACSMLFPGDSPTTEDATYVTFDRGKTWKLTLRTQGEADNESWDPDCHYGPGSVAYSLSEGIRPKNPKAYDRVDKSTDGGKTWQMTPLFIHAERTFFTIDHRPGPQKGWMYFYGMGNDKDRESILVGYSPDEGKTVFTQNALVEHGYFPEGTGPGVLLSDGTLLAPVPVYKPAPDLPYGVVDIKTRRPGAFRVVRAKFQQANWPLKIESVETVSDWFQQREYNGAFLPRLAADETDGPFRDRAYATWEEISSGRSMVKLSFSTDKGKTWSRPRVINDDTSRPTLQNTFNGPDDIHGYLAVNKQGVVGVMWLDRREYADNVGWAVRFRASFDGGETFLPSVKVSNVDYEPGRSGVIPLFPGASSLGDAPSTNDMAIGWFNFSGGHTQGLAADAEGRFHPLWVANPNGVPQMWTTDIAVDGHAEKNGAADLSKLEDASKQVRLEFLERSYNLKTHELDFDLRLYNMSESTIKGPVKVRVMDAGSYVGSVSTKNGETLSPVEGTVWDFSSLIPDGMLKPEDKSKTVRVRLDVRGINPFSQIGKFESGVTPLAILTTKVLAGSVEKPKDADKDKDKDGSGDDIFNRDR